LARALPALMRFPGLRTLLLLVAFHLLAYHAASSSGYAPNRSNACAGGEPAHATSGNALTRADTPSAFRTASAPPGPPACHGAYARRRHGRGGPRSCP